MLLSKVNPVFSDLRDLGQAFDIPVVGLNQRQISEALYSKIVQIVASSTASAVVTGAVSSFEFNVADHGAIGNGIADDTAAIQTTINLALTSGSANVRPIIRIPPGEYKITSGLDFRSDTVAPHVIATGATISWQPTGTAINQTAVSFGTTGVLTTITRGKVEGLWVQAGSTFASSGSVSTNANWSTSGHTAIEIHNCGSWNFEYIGARDMRRGIVLSATAPSSGYVGCAYNFLTINRVINCKYSIMADLLHPIKAFSNQHKIVGGNFAYSADAMYLNEMEGSFTTNSVVLTRLATGGYEFKDQNPYDPNLPRLPWDHASKFVVVGGLADWAQILTLGVDYTVTTGYYGSVPSGMITLISPEAKAIVDRNPSVLGLGSDKIMVYVALTPVASDTTFTQYEDTIGQINFTQDARELMIWQGVDKDKTLLRYGVAVPVENDYLVDVANRRITLTVPNTAQLPIIAMDRPRHVTIYANRGMSTPDMWNFDGCSFEGSAEYIDAVYIENANSNMFIGCRFECEHTRKMGFILGKASSGCNLIHGSQADLDDYHGNKEYRDFGGATSSSTRFYREVWEGKYLTLDGRVGFRTRNYQNAAVAVEPVSGDLPTSLLQVGGTQAWNTSTAITAMASSGSAISAQTTSGIPYYGLVTHSDDYDYSPILLRLIASTTSIPRLDGKLGCAIQMDGPVAFTIQGASGMDLEVTSGSALKVASGTYTFQASDIGYQVCITSTSPWVAGNYPITAVSGGVATLSSSPAVTGTTNGEFQVKHRLTSSLLRIYSRWMASEYEKRVSTTQFYVGDYNDLWRCPLTFTANGSDVAVLLQDRVGVRRTSTIHSGLYVPWVTGDLFPTAYFGSMLDGNNRTALIAESSGATPFATNTNSRYSIRSVVTDPLTGSITPVATPLVVAHKTALNPITQFGSGIEFRADTRPDTIWTDLIVDGTLDTKVSSASHSFSSSDINQKLVVLSTAPWTSGVYSIVSVDGTAAILSASPAPVSTSGGIWNLSIFSERLIAQIDARWFGTSGHIEGSRASRVTISPQCVSGSIDALTIDALADFTSRIGLGAPTGIRTNGDPTRASALYVPWTATDVASVPIMVVGGISSGASNTSVKSLTNTGIAVVASAAGSGIGLSAESTSGYPLTSTIVAGSHNTIVPAAYFSHLCSGTAASGIGTSVVFGAATIGATHRTIGGIDSYWADVTDATRRGRMSIWANRTESSITTAYEGVRVEALEPGAAGLGFFGATAVAKPTVTGDATDSGVVNLFSSLANLGLITNSSTTKGQVLPYVGKSGDYNVTVADSVIAVSASATMTLPAASSCLGSVFTIKNLSASTVTVSASDTIDGAGTYPLTTQYSAVTVQSNGSVYYVLGSH